MEGQGVCNPVCLPVFTSIPGFLPLFISLSYFSHFWSTRPLISGLPFIPRRRPLGELLILFLFCLFPLLLLCAFSPSWSPDAFFWRFHFFFSLPPVSRRASCGLFFLFSRFSPLFLCFPPGSPSDHNEFFHFLREKAGEGFFSVFFTPTCTSAAVLSPLCFSPTPGPPFLCVHLRCLQ